MERGANFAQEVPGAHENAERSQENTRERENLRGPSEQGCEVCTERGPPGFADCRCAMGEGPDENCRQVDQREKAQSAEPEDSAVTKMEACAAAGFEPGTRSIGWPCCMHMRGIFEERASNREGFCAGWAGVRMLPEVAGPEAGARGARDIGFAFTGERLHTNLFCAFREARSCAAFLRARKSRILTLSGRRPMVAAISSWVMPST